MKITITRLKGQNYCGNWHNHDG